MAEKINIADLPEFDASRYLDSDKAIVQYLTVVFEDGDPALLVAALGDIACVAGLSREALYEALPSDAQPRLTRWLTCAKH